MSSWLESELSGVPSLLHPQNLKSLPLFTDRKLQHSEWYDATSLRFSEEIRAHPLQESIQDFKGWGEMKHTLLEQEK